MAELERLLLSAESDRASCQREALQATEVLDTMRSTNEEVRRVGVAGGSPLHVPHGEGSFPGPATHCT